MFDYAKEEEEEGIKVSQLRSLLPRRGRASSIYASVSPTRLLLPGNTAFMRKQNMACSLLLFSCMHERVNLAQTTIRSDKASLCIT